MSAESGNVECLKQLLELVVLNVSLTKILSYVNSYLLYQVLLQLEVDHYYMKHFE